MGHRNRPKPAYTSPFVHSRGSRHYNTPRASALNNDDGRCRTIPRRRRTDRRKLEGNGILTVFPFADFFLRVRLGSTNPTQISFKWEPLFLLAIGILTRLDCYSQQDLLCCKVRPLLRRDFCPSSMPPYHLQLIANPQYRWLT